MGVIRNKRPKIHRLKLVSTVGGPFTKISKIDCRMIYYARPLCNTSSEAGALLSEVYVYSIEDDSDLKFSSQNLFKVFPETKGAGSKETIVHDLCYPDHYRPKIFFQFSKSTPTLRYTILDSRLPPCNAISEGRPLLGSEYPAFRGTYRE